MRAIFVAGALAFAPLAAGAQENAACAKFENPLAYNECLSKQGPKAGATRGRPEPPGAGRVARGFGGFVATRRKSGRFHMEFTISPR